MPGFAQGLTLISLAWVSTVAAVVIAPILPQMRQVFAAVPYVDVKISLVATGPSLLVAVMAIPFGMLADRIGRRGLLVVMLCLYGLTGTAPVWLSGLDAIVTSRIALGIAEAAIMTAGTALISDYYQGRSRERWLAAQTGTAPLTAVFLALIGGLLGGFGWRTPFYVYIFGFVLTPFVVVLLWEPSRGSSSETGVEEQQSTNRFNWSNSLWVSLAIMLTLIMFMVTVIQFGFLVSERGMHLPQTIGIWSAFVTIANPIGSVVFSVTKARPSVKMTIAYLLYALGFAVMSLIQTVEASIVGAFIANLAGGFYLPTAINWLLSTLPRALSGRGSGLWTTAVFLGQFLGPLAVLGLVGISGTLSHAIFICALICGIAAVAALVTSLTTRTAASLETR